MATNQVIGCVNHTSALNWDEVDRHLRRLALQEIPAVTPPKAPRRLYSSINPRLSRRDRNTRFRGQSKELTRAIRVLPTLEEFDTLADRLAVQSFRSRELELLQEEVDIALDLRISGDWDRIPGPNPRWVRVA